MIGEERDDPEGHRTDTGQQLNAGGAGGDCCRVGLYEGLVVQEDLVDPIEPPVDVGVGVVVTVQLGFDAGHAVAKVEDQAGGVVCLHGCVRALPQQGQVA